MSSKVLGNGPVTFTDSNGKQISIPLSALKFDENDTLIVDESKWSPYASYPADAKALINTLLTHLTTNQFVVPAPEEALKPAMTVKAVNPLGVGNQIKVDITLETKDADPTKTVFTITVTETDTYTDLTTDTIASVLGTEEKVGTQPGLVVVGDSPSPYELPQEGEYELSNGGTDAVASTDIPKSGDETGDEIAFTLKAKHPGEDGDLIQVAITAGSNTNQFNLTCTWTKSLTDMTLISLPANLSALGYVVMLGYPSEGAFSVPKAGSYFLKGSLSETSPSITIYADS